MQPGARRNLWAVTAYFGGIGAVLAALVVGIAWLIPPAESTGGAAKLQQWSSDREPARHAAAPVRPPIVEQRPQVMTPKPVPKGPAYGAMAKQKALAELAAHRQKRHAGTRPLSAEARSSFGHAPQPAYGPAQHGAQ